MKAVLDIRVPTETTKHTRLKYFSMLGEYTIRTQPAGRIIDCVPDRASMYSVRYIYIHVYIRSCSQKSSNEKYFETFLRHD